MKQSYKYTYTCLHINTKTPYATNCEDTNCVTNCEDTNL